MIDRPSLTDNAVLLRWLKELKVQLKAGEAPAVYARISSEIIRLEGYPTPIKAFETEHTGTTHG